MSDTHHNPYSPPRAEVRDVRPAGEAELAGKGRRLLNVLLDYVGFLVVSFAFSLAVGALAGGEGLAVLARVPDLVLGVVLMLAYYIVFEGLFGRTPAKFLTGTRVIDEQGRKPSLPKVLGRSAARFIPFEFLSFLGENGRGWHDRMSGTRVVRV